MFRYFFTQVAIFQRSHTLRQSQHSSSKDKPSNRNAQRPSWRIPIRRNIQCALFMTPYLTGCFLRTRPNGPPRQSILSKYGTYLGVDLIICNSNIYAGCYRWASTPPHALIPAAKG